MYAEGVGVPINLVQAHKWLNLAALAGNKNAPKDMKQLEGKMSHEQLEEARKMAQEWTGKHK
jgi:TPR repeat protein